MLIQLPYGKGRLEGEIDDQKLQGCLQCSSKNCVYESEAAIVEQSLKQPIGSKTLAELAYGKRHIVIIASDHTRPVNSRIILPAMLSEIEKVSPQAQISILIATGCHRSTTAKELRNKFGDELMHRLTIHIHDSESDQMADLGLLPSGAPCLINQLAVDADLLLAEGFIEPHFFAGYSGGRKSVLPGIASKNCVLQNHCAAMINSMYSRAGQLKGNPIHLDMKAAARKANLAFIVNVVLDEQQRIIASFAGDAVMAHEKGCAYAAKRCGLPPIMSDLVITSNNGYPLDQNLYQSVKGLSTAAETCRKSGIIIMACQCADGIGGEAFFNMFEQCETVQKLYDKILSVPAAQTASDQWQAQILARILIDHQIIMISDLDDKVIKAMHMIPAHTLNEAIQLANECKEIRSITVIPEGVSVFIQK